METITRTTREVLFAKYDMLEFNGKTMVADKYGRSQIQYIKANESYSNEKLMQEIINYIDEVAIFLASRAKTISENIKAV